MQMVGRCGFFEGVVQTGEKAAIEQHKSEIEGRIQ
jgi:hypothetical protein